MKISAQFAKLSSLTAATAAILIVKFISRIIFRADIVPLFFVVTIYECARSVVTQFVYLHKSDEFVTFPLTEQNKGDIIVT